MLSPLTLLSPYEELEFQFKHYFWHLMAFLFIHWVICCNFVVLNPVRIPLLIELGRLCLENNKHELATSCLENLRGGVKVTVN